MPLTSLPFYVVDQVVGSLLHNWPFLLFGILTAAALKVYVGTDRLGDLLRRRTSVAVGGAVTAAVATPFCSCGTTAVVLSALASAVPWAPIVAFMVASPLTSPDELILSAGLFGWGFALLFFAASIVLGIGGGVVAHVAERAGLLRNQARWMEKEPAAEPAAPEPAAPVCGCGSSEPALSFGPGAAAAAELAPAWQRFRLDEFGREAWTMGRKMFVLFVGFAAIGYAAIGIVPTSWMTTLLGGSSPLSVVVAATAGIPFYISSEGSLPLVASLMPGGMGTGPAMAFLITGAGTSIGAISGGLLIARWRVMAIVVGTLWVGAVVAGVIAQTVL